MKKKYQNKITSKEKKNLKIPNITHENAKFAVQKNLNLCQTGELRSQVSLFLMRGITDAKNVVQNEKANLLKLFFRKDEKEKGRGN